MSKQAKQPGNERRELPTPPKGIGVDNTERRFYKSIVKRMDGADSRKVGGEAAVYNSKTWMGWYWEVIEPGFFDEALPKSDIRALFNHDPSLVLARRKPTGEGTLSLELKETGLDYEFESPSTTAGNDLLENLRLGNVDESSFAFTTKEERWEEIKKEDGTWETWRYLVKAEEVFDVSPTTYGAYKATSAGLRSEVAKRSYTAWKEQTIEQEKTEVVKNRDARTVAAIIAEMELN